MLQKEAENLGHQTSPIDAKITQLNTDSKSNDFDFGDVVLERCVSYFRGLHVTSILEFLDVPVINRFDVANNCGNIRYELFRKALHLYIRYSSL